MQYAASMSNHLYMHSSDPETVCSGAEGFPLQILEILTLGSRYAANRLPGTLKHVSLTLTTSALISWERRVHGGVCYLEMF